MVKVDNKQEDKITIRVMSSDGDRYSEEIGDCESDEVKESLQEVIFKQIPEL